MKENIKIIASCKICGLKCNLTVYQLHLVARHWDWLETLRNKPDLMQVADKMGV